MTIGLNLFQFVLSIILIIMPMATADVSCGSHRAATCDLCPYLTDSNQYVGETWCNGDCFWDSGSNSCLLQLSAFVSLYNSLDMTIDKPAWCFQRIVTTSSQSGTVFGVNDLDFYESNSVGSGFHVDSTGGAVAYFHVLGQDVQIIACGTNVTCDIYETYGGFSEVSVDPSALEDAYFMTQAVNLGNKRMEYTGYFYHPDASWKLLSRMQVYSNDDEKWWFRDRRSFIQQYVVDASAQPLVRAARFGPSYVAGTGGENFVQVSSSQFFYMPGTNDDHVDAWHGGESQDAVGMVGIATGGDIVRDAVQNQIFEYPQVLPSSVLISFQLSIVCLNGSNNRQEIEFCIDCLNAGTDEDIKSCLPSLSPTLTPTMFPTIITQKSSSSPSDIPSQKPSLKPSSSHTNSELGLSLGLSLKPSSSHSDIPSYVTSTGLSGIGIVFIAGGSTLFVGICIGFLCWYRKRYKLKAKLKPKPRNEVEIFSSVNPLMSMSMETTLSTNGVQQTDTTTTAPLRTNTTTSTTITPNKITTVNTPLDYDVFLTHNWGPDESGRDNHARVGLINAALLKQHVSTWFDDDRMRGDIAQQMTEGIDNSRVVIVFITKTYVKKVDGKGAGGGSDNCKIEFDYSIRRKNVDRIITVVMENSCLDAKTWKGAVGAYLGGRLYIDFTDDTKMDSCIVRIKQELQNMIHGPIL